MPASKLMQKLRKDHAKQVKKLKPGARNNANIKPTPRPTTIRNNARNLNTAVEKMKAAQKKFNNNKNARTVKLISAKK